MDTYENCANKSVNTSTFSAMLYANPNNWTNYKHFGEDLSGHNQNTDETVGMIVDIVGTTALWTVSSGKREFFDVGTSNYLIAENSDWCQIVDEGKGINNRKTIYFI